MMIECGISLKKIREAFDFKLSEISGCLVSHEHLDHAKSIRKLNDAGVDCYMTRGTFKASKNPGHHRIKIINYMSEFYAGSWRILPFQAQHDSAEPTGFLIMSPRQKKILYLTDSYYCKYMFVDVEYFMIECNYSRKILDENVKAGLVHEKVRNRVLKSHFEIENVKQFFRSNDLTKCKEIYLIHLSKNNSDAELFKKEIEDVSGSEVHVCI